MDRREKYYRGLYLCLESFFRFLDQKKIGKWSNTFSIGVQKMFFDRSCSTCSCNDPHLRAKSNHKIEQNEYKYLVEHC